MSTYAEKLKDPRWQKKRLSVMERDGFKCRDCGDDKKTLHVHHCAYSGRNPWDADNAILLTLCDNCHKRRQKLEDAMHEMLGEILAKTSNKEVETIEADNFQSSPLEEFLYELEYASKENEKLTIITSSNFSWHQKEVERMRTELRSIEEVTQ